jgi:alpha-2-macroglobulin
MKGLSVKFGIILLINVLGLGAIYLGLKHSPVPVMYMKAVRMMPDRAEADRLQVVFDREIVRDKSIGHAELRPLCTLKPAWPGTWTWSASDTLEYLLDKPLPAGRVFMLSATTELEQNTGHVLKGKERFEIKTAPLEFVKCELMAIDKRDVTIRIVFSQPVEPDAFLKHVSFKDKQYARGLGRVLCVTKQPAKELVTRFAYPSTGAFQMRIEKGLIGYQADVGLAEDVVFDQEVKLAFSVYGADVERPLPGEPIQIQVQFSDQLDESQTIKGIKVDPPIADMTVSHRRSYLTLTGEFKPGRAYRISIPETILSQDGRALGKEVDVSVEVPDYRPQLAFKHTKGFLSPHGHLALGMRAVNLEGMKIHVKKILQNNLVHYLHGTDLDTISRVASDKTLKLDLEHNRPQDVLLELKGLVQRSGVYRIDACNVNNRWTRDHAIVAVTDLALTSKIEKDGIFVWVTSVRTGKPVSRVTVKALTYNNQLLATDKTNDQGIAKLHFSSLQPDGSAWVITAQKQGDLSYLQPQDWQWMTGKMAASSRAYAENYEAMLYTDRGVYRPGDTVHLTGIIREAQGGLAPTFPLVVHVFRPDGVRVKELPIKRQEGDQGVFHADYLTPEEGFTGQYRFLAHIAGDEQTLGSTEATVEAFLPVRMEVKALPVADWQGPNDLPRLNVSARYLWDQPGAKLPLSVTGWAKRVPFRSKGYPKHQFGQIQQATKALTPIKSQLDEAGMIEIPIEVPASLQKGLYTLHLSATVTEPGGRSVSDNSATVLDQIDLHLGLSFPQGDLVEANEPFPVDWVRLTGKDELASPGVMTVHLERVEYETVFKTVNNRAIWQTVEKAVHDVNEFQIQDEAAANQFVLNCPVPGRYRLLVRDVSTQAETRVEFNACNPLATDWTVPADRPEQLTITVDQKSYRPGATAQVRIQSPIEGTLLLTLETDQVVKQKVIEASGKSMDLGISLPENLRGSFFLVATVVREVDPASEDWTPHRAMGALQVMVDNSDRRLAVEMTVPSKAEPGERVTCAVDTLAPNDPNNPPYVHLWAVDQGILLAANYQMPNPFEFFLGPRVCGVQSADTFLQLLPDFKRPESMVRIGAGRYLEERLQRRSPVPMRRREAAVLWHEAVPLDSEGKAAFDLAMPELIGQMRVMAVVVDRDQYAHVKQDLTLTQALIAEATWPRFVAPGDQFLVPVKLFCSAEDPVDVGLKIHSTGPLELTSQSNLESVSVSPQSPTTLWLKAKATGIGPVDVLLSTESLDPNQPLTAQARGALTVRPATALHSETLLKQIPVGTEAYTYTVPKSFLKETTRTTVSVSGLPGVQLEAALEALIHYPYGCVEQTSSQLRSLLYVGQILGKDRVEVTNAMIKAGMTRLWGMQTRSGGLSYWPGSTEDCLWGTAYAALCLLEASEAGYPVETGLTKPLAKYLDRQLRVKDDEEMDNNSKALICRVLARFGQVPLGWMTRLAEQTDTLDMAGQAHLAAAFLAAGRRDRALSLLPERLSGRSAPTSTTGRLTSQTGQEAILLGVLLHLNPDHSLIPRLVARVEKVRSDGRWQSTLNNASCVSALCQYQIAQKGQVQDFQGLIQAKGHEPVSFDHDEMASVEFKGIDDPITVTSQGTGTLYLTITSEGQSSGELAPYAHGLSVTRRWVDQDGNDIHVAQLAVGDLIHSETTIQTTGATVHNIAIVDALCAGVEVENPSLATSSQEGIGRSGPEPDRTEFLDDRVLLFCSADSEPRTFRYNLRVTTLGEFVLPPIQASCMYDPEVACLGTRSQVTVVGRTVNTPKED